ncbi:hypothetical protein TorRG33x02_207060, partial [Trema orientale]
KGQKRCVGSNSREWSKSTAVVDGVRGG